MAAGFVGFDKTLIFFSLLSRLTTSDYKPTLESDFQTKLNFHVAILK
jgi:hypothetical protein